MSLSDLLFELSNDDRIAILEILKESPQNVTYISNKLDLRLQQTSRHLNRLSNVGVTEKTVRGDFKLTHYGEIIIVFLKQMCFISDYRSYFKTHDLSIIPLSYLKLIDLLRNSKLTNNVMQFLSFINSNLKQVEEYICLQIDQYPFTSIDELILSPDRGVKIKIIDEANETKRSTCGPEIAFNPKHITPNEEGEVLVEIRSQAKNDIYLYVSDKGCAVAFNTDRGFDYKGFISTDPSAIEWCLGLFNHFWDKSVHKVPTPVLGLKHSQPKSMSSSGSVVVVGHERPEFDFQAIQDAVDAYDEVILKGSFNIGNSTLILKRSITLRGEGRTNDVPDTKIYKKGWKFPFLSQEFMFIISGDDIDVTIENIHIENFNGTCINTIKGNSATIRRNRITLLSGLGRGLTLGNWGDHVVGITAGGETLTGGFLGGILIEENYLDFALSYARGGFITKTGLEREPDYRPDLQNHESSICVGMNICRNQGKVIVKNNVIRNMNSRGIIVFDNWETAEIEIVNNTIISDVFGSYPYNSPMAGVGIFVQSAWSEPRSGARVKVTNNKITCEKVNYCGIAVHGPSMYQKGAGKLNECIIKDNELILKEGYIGIQIRKSDFTQVINNRIAGKAYYGLQISGSRNRDCIELGAGKNRFEDNDMEQLLIRSPDKYSDKNIDGRMFTGSAERSETANIWLNRYTKGNIIKVKTNETVIDEGEENLVAFEAIEETTS